MMTYAWSLPKLLVGVLLLCLSVFYVFVGLHMLPFNFAHETEDKCDLVDRDLKLGISEYRALDSHSDKYRLLDRLSGPTIAFDDPSLIEAVRTHVLEMPRPYMYKTSYPLVLTPQAEEVRAVLKNMKEGFFVECGALDGERSSNTIMLDRQDQWTGLLVEADPSFYMQLRGKNRNVVSANVCLSPEKYPYMAQFKTHNKGQGQLAAKNSVEGRGYINTYCVPLYTLMLALNRTKIDFFSLDVEGFEVPILNSIPFDKLDISILTVEYKHGNKLEYLDLMEANGYRLHKTINDHRPAIGLYADDYIFVRKGLTL